MNERDREQLKDRLRALASAPLGLQIDTENFWSITGIRDPRQFFQNLPLLMEWNSTLYVEGISIHPEAATFYLRHPSQHQMPVSCGTVFPIPDVYHLEFTTDTVDGILDLVAQRPIRELLTHVSGYHLRRMVFSFHDAFESRLEVSGDVSEPVVKAFCSALEVSYSHERMEKRVNPYRQLLEVLDHPERIKTPKVAWWRDFVDAFRSGWRNG